MGPKKVFFKCVKNVISQQSAPNVVFSCLTLWRRCCRPLCRRRRCCRQTTGGRAEVRRVRLRVGRVRDGCPASRIHCRLCRGSKSHHWVQTAGEGSLFRDRLCARTVVGP